MTDANNNVFDQSTPAAAPADPAVDATPTSIPYASELVGEGKKFKTVQDLEKGKVESDAFITNLQGEMDRLRQDLDKRTTVEEALERLQAGQSTENNTSSAMDADELAKLVATQVTKLDSDKVASTNIDQVNSKMNELYGETAKETLSKKALELGVTVDFLKDTSAKSPQAFYNLMGINTAANNSPTGVRTPAGINTQALNASNTNSQWEHFEKIRKEDPRRYHSPQVQQEMFKAQKDGLL